MTLQSSRITLVVIFATSLGLLYWLFSRSSLPSPRIDPTPQGSSQLLEIGTKKNAPIEAENTDHTASPISTSIHSRNWSLAETLREKIVSVSGNPYLSSRRRIVRTPDFDFPILLSERIVIDPSNGESFVELNDSMVADQLVISSENPIDTTILAASLSQTNWSIGEISRNRQMIVLQSETAEIDTVLDGLTELRNTIGSETEYAIEPNTIYYATATSPNDSHYANGRLWGLVNDDDNDIDAPEGWDLSTDASNLTIAVIDSGIRNDHEDLAANMWRNQDEVAGNGLDDDENGYIDDVFGANILDSEESASDDFGHGTHVTGIIGAVGNNDLGIAGVAWQANLMAVKFLNASGRGTLDDAVDAIDYAIENGAKIINASWGADGYSPSLELAMKRALKNDVFIVAAAGNESRDIDDSYFSPASSELINVISVASIDESGERSPFSNYGTKNVDLTAPGHRILSTWHESTDSYSQQSGTSMAAPYVTGILALNVSLRPNDDLKTQVDRLVLSSKPRKTLLQTSRSSGIASLNASLSMEKVPYPPVIETHSELKLFERSEGSVQMTVTVSRETNVEYQWYFEGQAMSGKNAETLSLYSITEADQGTYRFIATNEDGEAQIQFDLNVLTPDSNLAGGLDADASVIVIAENDSDWSLGIDPLSRDSDHVEGRVPGAYRTSVLRAIVRGPGDLRFLWKITGVDEYGPRPEYFIGNEKMRLRGSAGKWQVADTRLTEDKDYEIVWTIPGLGVEGEDNGTLYIDYLNVFPIKQVPPIIFRHPEDAKGIPFDDISFETWAFGSDLSYEWFRDDESLTFFGDSRFTLRKALKSDEGSYYCVVSNSYGQDISHKAALEIDENQTPAYFIERSKNFKGVAGQPLDITLEHAGSPTVEYKWLKGGVELFGENKSSLSFNPLRMEHAGSYRMEIENPHGQRQYSDSIYVNVVDRDLSPNAVLGERDLETFQVTTGFPINIDYWIATEFLPLELQWYRDGVPVESQTNRKLIIENPTYQDMGDYFLEFKNDRGSFRTNIHRLVMSDGIGEALDDVDPLWIEHNNSNRGWRYYQEEVSFDGQDAIEFSRMHEFDQPSNWDNGGFYSSIGKYFTGPKNISVYWKRTSEKSWFEAHVGPQNGQRDLVAKFNETGPVGSWQKSVIHVPAGEHFVTWKYVGTIPEAKGWLDQIEETDVPAIVSQPPEFIIGGSSTTSISMNAWGPGVLAYQWYKNGNVITDQTTPRLSLNSNSIESDDTFFLEVSSEYGKTRSAIFRPTSISRIVDVGNLEIELSDNGHWEWNRLWDTHNSMRIHVKPHAPSWAEFEVNGPAVLTYNGTKLTPWIDRKIVSFEEWSGPASSRSHYLHIPSGNHIVRLNAGAYLDETRTLYIHNLKVAKAPLLEIENTGYTNGVSNYRENAVVYFAAKKPVSIKWYKDGNLHKHSPSVSSDFTRLFEAPKSIEDIGRYYCEVTDADGNVSRSTDFVIRKVDTLEFGEIVGDSLFRLCDSYYPFFYDTKSFIEGDSSAYTTITSETDRAWFQVCQRNSNGSAYPGSQLSVRISGFDDETIVSVYDGDESLHILESTEDWQTLNFVGNSSNIYFDIGKSKGTELTIWIDGAKTLPGVRVIDQPKHFATYLNGKASFSVEVFSIDTMSYQWQLNGKPISGANSSQYEIKHIAVSDLGDYEVVVSSSGNQAISSKANLSIAEDLGAALEMPGLRVTTWGDALWTIDETVSIDGTRSLRSGDVDPGEFSSLRIEFDFPGMYSIYGTLEYFGGQKQRWETRSGISGVAPFHEEFTLTRARGSSRNNPNRYYRLDRLSFSPLSSQNYEKWLSRNSFLANSPADGNSLFDEFADTDGDGVPNIMEFLFDLNPLKKSSLPEFLIENNYGQIVARLPYRFAANGDYNISFEISDDLKTWRIVRPEDTQSFDPLNKYYDIESVISMPTKNQIPSFIRWTVSEPKPQSSPLESSH